MNFLITLYRVTERVIQQVSSFFVHRSYVTKESAMSHIEFPSSLSFLQFTPGVNSIHTLKFHNNTLFLFFNKSTATEYIRIELWIRKCPGYSHNVFITRACSMCASRTIEKARAGKMSVDPIQKTDSTQIFILLLLDGPRSQEKNVRGHL